MCCFFRGVYLDLLEYILWKESGASGKEPACQCRRRKRLGFDPRSGKIPHAMGQRNPCSTTRKATAMRNPHTTTRESPCTAMKTEHNQKEIKNKS